MSMRGSFVWTVLAPFVDGSARFEFQSIGGSFRSGGKKTSRSRLTVGSGLDQRYCHSVLEFRFNTEECCRGISYMSTERFRNSLAIAPALWLLLLAAASVPASRRGKPTTGLKKYETATVKRFERSIARVHPLMKRYGYWAAATAIFVEGIGVPAPGQTLLIASALEAASGRMKVAVLLVWVTAATILGNSVGYAIGRWGGRWILDKFTFGSQRQHHLDDLFRRRGGVVILVGRFIEGL